MLTGSNWCVPGKAEIAIISKDCARMPRMPPITGLRVQHVPNTANAYMSAWIMGKQPT